MAKKTYKTFRMRGLQILTKDENGKRVEITFRGGVQIDSTARFSTSDEALQKKLESMEGFGTTYYLESVSDNSQPEKVVEAENAPVEKKEETPMTDVKDIKRFHNIVEMRNYMAELGFEGVEKMNYMQAKSAAAKQGYDFQISKDK